MIRAEAIKNWISAQGQTRVVLDVIDPSDAAAIKMSRESAESSDSKTSRLSRSADLADAAPEKTREVLEDQLEKPVFPSATATTGWNEERRSGKFFESFTLFIR